MYIPLHDIENDPVRIREFILQYPFGLLITGAVPFPAATHLPFLLIDAGEDYYLEGHLSRANAQSESIISGQKALIIFAGPQAYISHTVYENPINVPTWNYVAVHLSGSLRLLEEGDKASHIERMMFHYEGPDNSWPHQKDSYREGMLRGIIAFRFEIEKTEARFKLSRNKSEADRLNVIGFLNKNPQTHAQDIAAMMSEELKQ